MYQQRISKNVKTQFPEVFKNESVKEINENICKTITPENNYHMSYQMRNMEEEFVILIHDHNKIEKQNNKLKTKLE